MALNEGVEHKALGPYEDKTGPGVHLPGKLVEVEAIRLLTHDGMQVPPGATVHLPARLAQTLIDAQQVRRVP